MFSLDYEVLDDKGNQNGKEREEHEDDGCALLVAERPPGPRAFHSVSAGAGRWFSPLGEEEHCRAVGTDEVLMPRGVLALANGTHAETIFTVQLKA